MFRIPKTIKTIETATELIDKITVAGKFKTHTEQEREKVMGIAGRIQTSAYTLMACADKMVNDITIHNPPTPIYMAPIQRHKLVAGKKDVIGYGAIRTSVIG